MEGNRDTSRCAQVDLAQRSDITPPTILLTLIPAACSLRTQGIGTSRMKLIGMARRSLLSHEGIIVTSSGTTAGLPPSRESQPGSPNVGAVVSVRGSVVDIRFDERLPPTSR
jgi:hypothetical protein